MSREPHVGGASLWTDGTVTSARVMVERIDAIGRIRISSAPKNVDLLLTTSPLLTPGQARDIAARLTQMADEIELTAETLALPAPKETK